MKNILISTIVRDRANFLHNWISQLDKICESRPEINFYLSVYENDSVDDSKSILKSIDYSNFKDVSVVTEDLRTPYFESVQSAERVKLLAEARNKTLFENNFLQKCDWVISVEPDVKYEINDILRIIDNDDYDILSGRSRHFYTPVESQTMYDDWATRKDSSARYWISNVDFDRLMEVWSTYNCFCKYNAEPIKNNVGFSGFNDRIQSHDCDTAVICENFRKEGYTKIALDGTVNVLHMT